MTEESTLLLLRLDTDSLWTSMDACHWTAVKADAEADAKISASAHLYECRMSTEIKWQ